MLPQATDQQLGQALRRWRDALDLRGYQLAEQAGFSQGYLSDIENGRRRLNDEIAERIGAVKGLDLTAFELELAALVEPVRQPARIPVTESEFSGVREDEPVYRVRVSTPGLPSRPAMPGMEDLARALVATLSKQQAAELVGRFMAEYQAGDESGLAKANAILYILSDSAPS